MTEPNNHLPRVYGEQEIGRILKRATELQHSAPSAPAAGLTLADLEEIAAEAGIDPVYLRRAALELDSGVSDSSVWSRVVGDELLLVRDVTLPGELSDDGFERILSAIQTHTRLHGQPSLLGRTLTWRAETQSKTRTIQIVITTRDGRTNIRVEENLAQLASGLVAGVTSGVGIGVGLGVGVTVGVGIGSVALAVAAPLGIVALSFLGSREIYRNVTGRRRRAIDRLLDRIVAEAQDSIASATLPENPR